MKLCIIDPGFGPDLWLITEVRTRTEIWIGHRDFVRALARGDVQACGDRALERSLPQWLSGTLLSQSKNATGLNPG